MISILGYVVYMWMYDGYVGYMLIYDGYMWVYLDV